MSDCKRSCCWTPFEVCAAGKGCSCHTGGQPVFEKLTFEERVRAQAVRKSKGRRP